MGAHGFEKNVILFNLGKKLPLHRTKFPDTVCLRKKLKERQALCVLSIEARKIERISRRIRRLGVSLVSPHPQSTQASDPPLFTHHVIVELIAGAPLSG